MTGKLHLHPADVHGFSRLAVDGVGGIVELVEDLHQAIARTPLMLGDPDRGRTRGITGLVYRIIGGATGLVGGALDSVFRHAVPLAGQPASSPRRESMLALVNGVIGDHLEATGNPLAIPMSLRRHGRALDLETGALAGAFPRPGSKIMVLAHGLCMSDLRWTRSSPPGVQSSSPRLRAADPERLAGELGHTPLYLHYNSGRHVSANGRDFAGLMEALFESWPVPVEEIAIVGHSMGGLVARSACHYGNQAGHGWPERLRKLVFLGTPHHGSPLERLGNRVDPVFNISAYSAPFGRLGKIRSAGVTDLRHGNLVDEDWQGRDRFSGGGDHRRPLPLPAGTACYAIAAATAARPSRVRDRILGDGLVPVDSALGRHPKPHWNLAIPEENRWVVRNTGHLGLLDKPRVYRRLRRWLAE